MDAVAYRAWAVGSQGLGATFDADETHVILRVYSSSATRIEVWLYDQPTGSSEKARVALDVDPQNGIWSKTIPQLPPIRPVPTIVTRLISDSLP